MTCGETIGSGLLTQTPVFNQIAAGQFTCGSVGTATQFNFKLDQAGGSDTCRGYIYEDNSGAPGALRATSSDISVTGVGTFSGAISYNFSSTTIHLAILCDGTTAMVNDIRPGDFATQMSYKTATYPTAPDPFARDGTVDRKPTIWIDYTESSGTLMGQILT